LSLAETREAVRFNKDVGDDHERVGLFFTHDGQPKTRRRGNLLRQPRK
jgi:hypothetical protein